MTAPAYYFDDPRLRMTLVGRLCVRVVSWASSIILVAATLTMLVSDLLWARFLGGFFLLFVLDRVWRWDHPDISLSELSRKKEPNIARALSPRAFDVVEHAYDRSRLAGTSVAQELLKQLVDRKEVAAILARVDVPRDEFRERIEALLDAPPEGRRRGIPAEESREQVAPILVAACEVALRHNREAITTKDILVGLSALTESDAAPVFDVFSLTARDLELALVLAEDPGWKKRLLRSSRMLVGRSRPRLVRHRIMNRAWTSRPTPTLDAHGHDFTDLARSGHIGFLVGHHEEYERLVDVLARPANPNVLLVGEVGTGKESLVAHLAWALAHDEVPESLFDRRLVSLEIARIVAGGPESDLQNRLQRVVQEIMGAGNIILFIPDIHNLVKTSGAAYLSAADALLPIVANNSFPVIGATYPREFKHYIEPRTDFVGSFEVVRVAEIGEDDALVVATYEARALEWESGREISFGAVRTAVRLAKKHLHEKLLPGSAVELLKEAIVIAEKQGLPAVVADTIADLVEQKTHIPTRAAEKEEAATLLNLEEVIHGSFVDQDDAVRAVANALREYRSGLTRRGGPIASFLFVGPTGVGKTELAKIVARIQFGSEGAMVRFDMSEYQDVASSHRFIGSSDGQIAGILTDAIAAKPYSLILLDEVEKAHPDILNLFLQVLDDGRLTDGLGRTIDFTNTIVIATSNAHSEIMTDALARGQSMGDVADYVKRKLTDVFRPEFLNRFSQIVIFRDLGPDQLRAIVRLALQDLAARVGEQGIEVTFDEEVVEEIKRIGYEPAFGARPLRRAIEEYVRAPLAKEILAQNIRRGGRIEVSHDPSGFIFRSGPVSHHESASGGRDQKESVLE